MTKKFIINDDVFKTQVLFIVNCDFNKFAKIVKKYGIELDDFDEYTSGTVIRGVHNIFRIVWIKKYNIPELVHELFHLVVRICEDKGIPIKANIETGECGDEVAAYLMEFYIEQFNRRYHI